MMFINDLVDNMNSNHENAFTTDELVLFMILYADDAFVFAKSKETLQSLLHDIELYCGIWGLPRRYFFCGSFMFLFCLVFAMFCARLFICASWSPAGKGLTSWLSFVVSSVSLSLSHWYPGSGVVLDCIDS